MWFFFQAEDGIRDVAVTGVQTCALPICLMSRSTWIGAQGWLVVSDEILFEPRVEKWRRNASFAQRYLLCRSVDSRRSFRGCNARGSARSEGTGHDLDRKRAGSDCGPERCGRSLCQGYDHEQGHGTKAGIRSDLCRNV